VGIALFVGIAGNVDFGIGIIEFWSFHFLGEVSCVRERRQAFSAFFTRCMGSRWPVVQIHSHRF
jgi:hypothetical protein